MLRSSADQLPQNHSYNGIDVVKFICAVFVCIIHIKPFQGDLAGAPAAVFLNDFLQKCFCRIAVPFYFTASGFFLFRKMDLYHPSGERVKAYCLKILRLLGIWFFLLFLGRTIQLWYLGAVVVAAIVLLFLLKKGVRLRYIAVISAAAYLIGLLGDSYYGFIEPLKSFFPTKLVIVGYETLFTTTRNGLFFGLIFVFMGVVFAKKRIVMPGKIAVCGFIASLVGMFFEVFLLKNYSHPKDYNMTVFLVPTAFFLFYLATHVDLKNRTIYGRLRVIGMLVFYSHLFVDFFVEMAFRIAKGRMGIDLFPFRCLLTILLSVALAVIIETASKKEKFGWLKYLYE